MNIDYLKQSWCLNLSSSSTSIAWFDLLCKEYQEPYRVYHNLDHIEHMLRNLGEIERYIKDHTAFYMAIWFHDAVNPSSYNSEKNSTVLCHRAMCDMNMSQIDITKATCLIMSTVKHGDGYDNDFNFFMDLDLAILGAPPDEYEDYAIKCRKENGTYGISLYCDGRINILEGFLKRKSIYKTSYFWSRLERQARENLTREILTLKNIKEIRCQD